MIDKHPLFIITLLFLMLAGANQACGEGVGSDRTSTGVDAAEHNPGSAATSVNAIVSVKDFGAKGDDHTDDLAAFEAAAAALQPWQTLYIPPGSYRLSGKWTVKNKYRTRINCDGVIKPKSPYDGYLVEFFNDANDPIGKSMAQQIVVRGLTVDGEWKSRGVKIARAYDSSFENLHIWRPYGHGLYTPMLQEVSFYKPVIFMGKPRLVKAEGSSENIRGIASDWNPADVYAKGQYVRSAAPAFSRAATYNENALVNSDGILYRSIVGANTGNVPSASADKWERIGYSYFKATGLTGNKNKNPVDGKTDYTTRSRIEADKFWVPVYADEAAWEMVGDGPHITIDNVKVWNFISRSNAQNTVLRIDNTQYSLPASQVEFYASQLHAITEQYISAFNADSKMTDADHYNGNLVTPTMATLVHAASTIGLKFIGGQLRTANMDWAKGLVVGSLGVSGNAARTFLSSVSINGDGDYGVGISVMPSVETYGANNWLESSLEMHMGGVKSVNRLDLHGETETFQTGMAIVPKGATTYTVSFDPSMMAMPIVNITPMSDTGENNGGLGGLSWQVTSVSNKGFTIKLTGNFIGAMQTAAFSANGGDNQKRAWNHNFNLPHNAVGIGLPSADPGSSFRLVSVNDSANSIGILAPQAPQSDTVIQYWGIWENKAPVSIRFAWSAQIEPE